MKKILTLTAAALFVANFAYADNVGCGLGTQIITEKDTVLMQVFAVTTNGTSGNQTFGITSGTLGCKKPAKFASSEKVNIFVQSNMDSLAFDIAKGQGETLDTLASLMGVEDTTAFGQKLQAKFDSIYSSADVEYADVVDAIYAEI
ncbi:DUF3015 family protein [Seleniivibrio woodruffii]|uniref:DUF3015 family protein n=1 Tax=Seleniivibrio woodruffii TaxID=1078050 RepID=A0A4R1KCJ1_9BACT|nr:DUF3015 family protein [Seleniivibrio woodruffii]TCK62318.1 hypothetical protein C8D98_0841 [Seleniivibrio woodruffii]TVZ34565.1 Protein of unknown function (DUF3015) [Seleniivibrio woodruffii]